MHVRENTSSRTTTSCSNRTKRSQGPCPSPWVIWEGGGMNWRTDGRRHLPTSRPWFYPVVEQHDVTYHRVKPLTWHRRQTHNAKPKQKNATTKNNNIYTERKTWNTADAGGRMDTWWVDGGQKCCRRWFSISHPLFHAHKLTNLWHINLPYGKHSVCNLKKNDFSPTAVNSFCTEEAGAEMRRWREENKHTVTNIKNRKKTVGQSLMTEREREFITVTHLAMPP